MAAVSERRVQLSGERENDTLVAVHNDHLAAFESMLQALPNTRQVMVVIGNSPSEKTLRDMLERELKPLEGRIKLEWTDNLSFPELLKSAATLPPHSAIYWYNMSVDAAGVAHEGDKPLTRVHAVANAPIFSYDDSYFGRELLGGPMQSVAKGSRQIASVAVRILGGEKAGDIKTSVSQFSTPKYDWRELQRWGISESLLPRGSEVLFREPTAWQKYRMEISATAAALLAQAALIIWLLYEHRRRHEAEITARGAMADLMQMDRLASAGEFSASVAHEINQPLGAMTLNARAAMNFLKAKTPDLEEVHAALGQIWADGHRASQIVSNLRAMFKKDAPQGQPEPVDINNVIRSVLDLASVELRKDQIVVRTHLDDELPKVLGSQVQLQQLVLNLVMNAKDAMRSVSGQRELVITSKPCRPNEIEVSVEDSGPGISETERNKIFQPMFTTKSNGMGMGLAICKSIVESHHGRITVTSGSKGGAVFRFQVPTHVPSPSTVAA